MRSYSVARINQSEIIRAYENRAISYSRLAVVQRQLATWLAEWLESPRTASWQTALEFGAGDGIFTRLAADRYATFAATDISPAMVQQGLRRLPHLTWRVADAWDYTSPAVDRVFSSSLLQWCPRPESILAKWRGIVRAGGRMLHGIYVSPSLAEWHSHVGSRSPLVWRNAAYWRQLFHRAGWNILRSDCRTHVQEFPSGLDFLRFLRHTGATCGSRVSVSDLRKRLANYEREFPARDLPGGVTSTWTLFRIEVTHRQGQNK